MTMKHSSIVATISVLMLSVASGQDTLRFVTLDQAVAIALEKNRELKSARLDVERADARVREAWGYALPVLDFSGQYTRALERPVFFPSGLCKPREQ